MRERTTAFDYIWRLLLLAWALAVILPLLWLLYESLKTNQEFYQDIWGLPTTPQWGNYAKAIGQLGIGKAFLNTAYYVGGGLLLGLLITSLNAYALTRLRFRGRNFIWGLIMLSLFLPGINALVPQYVLMRTLHLTNSLTGIIILSSFGEHVFYLLVLSGFMKSIPRELEESAQIDGASLWKVFWHIIIPLSKPGLVTVAIFSFLNLYNNFLTPFIYVSDSSKYPISVQMYNAYQLMQYQSDWVTLLAGVIVAAIPPVVLYALFRRQVIEGATLGSLKG